MLPALPSPNPTAHHHHHHHHRHPHHHQQRQQQHHVHPYDSNSSTATAHSAAPKRNSSMIFRIEHLLPPAPTPASTPTPTPAPTSPTRMSPISLTSNLATPTNGTRRTKSTPRFPGVYLKQFAPKDTLSDVIGTLTLMSTSTTVNMSSTDQNDHIRSSNSRTYCSIQQGVLRLSANVMRRIKLSEDIHSYNALFEAHNGDVRLRIVRDISRDEELIAWFDEELTILMAIPFLTPLNIQGNSRYTCHICQLTFETPNPLKIHLALSCGRHTLDILWIRLHYALKSATAFQQQHQHHLHHHHHHQQLSMPILHHHLPTISPALRSTPQLTCTTTTTLTTNSPLPSPRQQQQQERQPQRFSAFKPITSSTTNTSLPSSTISVTSPPASTSISPQASASPSTSSTVNMLPTITTTASMAPSTSTMSLPHTHAQFAFLPALTTAPMSLLQAPHGGPLNAAAQIEAIVSNMGASKQGHLCIYCGKVYSRKYGLKIHIRTHTGFKPLKCKFCLRPFGDPSNLNKHVRLHLQSSAASSSTTTSSAGVGVSGAGVSASESIEGYKCHLCHKTLARRRDLQRHIESRHNSSS